MDRRSYTDFLFLWTRPWNIGCSWQLQQIYQQRLQGCPDRLLGKFIDQHVCWLCHLLGCWLHGSRTTETCSRSCCFRTRISISCLPFCSPSVTRRTSLVVSFLLYVTFNWSGFAILYYGRVHHCNGKLSFEKFVLFSVLFE